MLIPLITVLGLLASHCQAAPLQTAEFSQLHQRAAEMQLHKTREWLGVMHYILIFPRGLRSGADFRNFFFDITRGPGDPQAELHAAIDVFYDPKARLDHVPFLDAPVNQVPPDDFHPQCVFPARYAFLKSKLGPARFEPRCTRYEDWLHRIDAVSATLVYATAYMGNPASTFGHTFLRINSHASDALLDYGVNYAAAVPQDTGFIYAMLGILGGFPGNYSLLPYHVKVQEYAQGEQRDVWEYDLTLRNEEITRFMAHLWEMGSFAADYYFFRRNCALELLWLIEYARPSLNLVHRVPPWVIPTETVRVVSQAPGLVSATHYRPSIASRIKQRLATLDRSTKLDVKTTLQTNDLSAVSRIASETDRATSLELVADFLEYKKKTNSNILQEKDILLQRESLLARSRISATSLTPEAVPMTPQPDRGHGIFRLAAGAGVAQHYGSFTTLDIRPSYHDILANPEGYGRHFELVFPQAVVRYYHRAQELDLERFDIARAVSIAPLSDPLAGKTWHGGILLENRRDIQCNHCGYMKGHGGLGLSDEFEPLKWLMFTPYTFADVNVQMSGRFRHSFRVGPSIMAGSYIDIAHGIYRADFNSSIFWLPLGDNNLAMRDVFDAYYFEARLKQNLSLSKNFELRVEMAAFKAGNEALAVLGWYF